MASSESIVGMSDACAEMAFARLATCVKFLICAERLQAHYGTRSMLETSISGTTGEFQGC